VALTSNNSICRRSAIGFCRLSTEEQARDGRAGLLRQHQEIHIAADRWSLDIVEIIEVSDVSGTQVVESPEFQHLLRSLPSVDGIIVAAIDRLMRPDDFSSFSIYDHFLKQRKLIWTPGSALDVGEDSGFMEALVSGMMAGLDRRRILRNTQIAKEENRKRGRCANAKITLPQGVDFDFKTGKWSWIEPWASRVKTAFETLVTSNRSVLSIAKELGYTSERTLYNQLRNPIWTGYREYNLRRGEKLPSKNGRQADRRKVPRDKPLRVKIDLEPLVSEALFVQAQRILAGRRRTWVSSRAEESRFELSGLLVCRCGERMYSKGSGRCKRQRLLDIYYCKSQHKGGRGCGAPKLYREVIDHTVSSLISEVFLQPVQLTQLVERALESGRDAGDENKIQKASSEIARLQAEKQKLLALTVKGIFSEADALPEARRIDSELRTWRTLLEKAEQDDLMRSNFGITEAASLIASAFAEFPLLGLSDRKRLTRKLVKAVQVEDRRVTAVTLTLPRAASKISSRTDKDSSPRQASAAPGT
jgi:DNA invertase Pin-like site-specific DNA recombinase